MAPRSYTLRQRADSAATTRQRIVDAAIAVYRARGVTGATMAAIAQAADVSRGTVINHFGDLESLLEAVLERALGDLDIPDERALEGASSGEDRARRYVDAMFTFYERTSDWWSVFTRDGGALPALPAIQRAEAGFYEAIGRFERAALGDVRTDPVLAVAVPLLVGPSLYFPLRNGGLTAEEVAQLVGDLLVAALARRSGVRAPNGRARGAGGIQ